MGFVVHVPQLASLHPKPCLQRHDFVAHPATAQKHSPCVASHALASDGEHVPLNDGPCVGTNVGAKEGAAVLGAAVGIHVGELVGSDVLHAWCSAHVMRSNCSRLSKVGVEM